MKVLHDWDRPFLDKDYAFRRGIYLLLYVATIKLPFLRKLKFIRNIVNNIQHEKFLYLETLIRLDLLVGIEPIIGIRDIVYKEYFGLLEDYIKALNYIYDNKIDFRLHKHIGDKNDENRIRIWEPSLNQSKESWAYDVNYFMNNIYLLDKDELPIFHIDRPYALHRYIDWLYEVIIEKMQIYKSE